MSIIGVLFLGFLIGILARAIVPGRNRQGLVLTILLGIGGGILASVLGRYLKIYGDSEAAGFFAALVGAVVILLIVRFFKSPSD